jgi:hypothetical protein
MEKRIPGREVPRAGVGKNRGGFWIRNSRKAGYRRERLACSQQLTENETFPALKKLLRFADYPGSVFF